MRDRVNRELKQALIGYLSECVTEQKRERIEQVLALRTRYISVVLEDIYQPHNASAVLRSCECFGVQDAHIIENHNTFTVSPGVVAGSSKWLSIYRYNQPGEQNTRPCIEHLRKQGYRIVATTLRPDSIHIQELDLSEKVALCFGTEELGLTEEAHRLADIFVQIPMYGFTQSLNISVSAALCLFALTGPLRSSQIKWQLNESEKLDLRLKWLINSLPHGDALVRRFLEENSYSVETDSPVAW